MTKLYITSKNTIQNSKTNKTQRIIGFLLCFGVGGTLLISCIPSIGLILVTPTFFALLYSSALILLFLSTFFLYGPQAQFKKLFSSFLRGLAFLICICSTLFTFYCIFRFRYFIVIIIAIIIQLGASLFYGFSLLPFAQSLMDKHCCKKNTNQHLVVLFFFKKDKFKEKQKKNEQNKKKSQK